MSALDDHFAAPRVSYGGRPGRWLNRPGVVPGLCGAALATALVGLRAVASADLNSVSIAGHVLPWGCSFRQRFGVPCPLCGMTRSVLLTLHSQLTPALQLNPAGPVLVFGLALLSCALVGLLLCAQLPRTRGAGERLHRRIQLSATIYAGLLIAVVLTHWLLALRAH